MLFEPRKKKPAVETPPEVVVTLLRDVNGTKYLRLTSATGNNSAVAPVVERPCQRHSVDLARAAPVAVRVAVSRDRLLQLARLAESMRGRWPMRCELLRSDPEGAVLKAIVGTTDDPGVGAEIPVAVLPPEVLPNVPSFTVLPGQLREVVQRVKGNQLCLAYRPTVNELGVSTRPETGTAAPTAEAFVRASPLPPAAVRAAPAEPAAT